MKRIFCLRGLSSQLPQVNSCFSNFLPKRNAKIEVNTKWKRPLNPPVEEPKRTGDLNSMPPISDESVILKYQDSEELKTASDAVKKIFSLHYQLPKNKKFIYENQLVEKVKRHKYDDSSIEVKIARATARIHFYQHVMKENPKMDKVRAHINVNLGKRTKYLTLLRKLDYKRFEWILEKLNIVYKPYPLAHYKVTRHNSLVLLTKLKMEKEKEEKLGALKKSFDEQKIPFLNKKLEKLKWIKEMEAKYDFPKTVTDDEIEDVKKRIEKVKIDIEENQKRGYVRDIHPFFLEPYYKNVLLEKEEKLKNSAPLY